VSETDGGSYFPICASNTATPLLISSSDYPGVIRAFTDLQTDVERVTGIKPTLTEGESSTAKKVIIAGTLGKSTLIDKIVSDNAIDVSQLQGKWEMFLTQTISNPMSGVDEALVIIGSDKRGTIFGIYDISEQMGVSPWHWWADVPAQEKSSVYVKPGVHTLGEPSVKYRGIFINDEAPALSGWVGENYGRFNHNFYEKVFELILRHKANFLWPAMWGKSLFEDDTQSPGIADMYGVVLGTSHHEPLLRAQQDWKNHGSGAWDYTTNTSTLQNFWREGVRRNGNKEAIMTVGMRGDGDVALTGASKELLERIVKDQRSIIEDVTGKPASETPQLWALYKEVQNYYDDGMRVPDDVTLLFCDDNWGNVRRLPDPGAPERSGGYGMYYHFDYVGGPRSYRWLNTNAIPRVWEQMNLCYEHDVKQIWLVNVGDLKLMELPTAFFLDMAWRPEQWTPENVGDYTRMWSEQQFGKEHAEAIGNFQDKYTKFNARRKHSLIDRNTYHVVNYREAEREVGAFIKLAEQVDSVEALLPSKYHDAYYQLVKYPVAASANLNEMYYYWGLSGHYASQGRAATNDYVSLVGEKFNNDKALTDYYHRNVANGKWNHIASQPHIGYTSWESPSSNVKPSVSTINISNTKEMGVAIENSSSWWPNSSSKAMLPLFDAYHKQSYYIEVFARGTQSFTFTAEPNEDWVILDKHQGQVSKQERINVSIDWENVPKGTNTASITITADNGRTVSVGVSAYNPESPAAGEIVGNIESDGYISIDPKNYSSATNKGNIQWHVIPDFGRTGSGVTFLPTNVSSQSPGGTSPHLSYDVYWYSNETNVKVNAYFGTTIDYLSKHNGLRYAISFDDESPQTKTFNADNDNARRDYVTMVSTTHTVSAPGLHTLKYWAVDPGVVLQKLVIDINGTLVTYLGPPDTYVEEPPKGPIVALISPTTRYFEQGDEIHIEATAEAKEGEVTAVEFFIGDESIGIDSEAPYTAEYTLSELGSAVIRAVATDTHGDSRSAVMSVVVNIPQVPFSETPHAIPGTIELEEFDVGGNGYAYYDVDAGTNVDPAPDYRKDEDVDIEICTDDNGGYNLGWTAAGEWLEYTVNVEMTGTYELTFRVACEGSGRTISLESDGAVLASNIAIPNTSDWQEWENVILENVELKAGKQVLRLTIGSEDYVNLNYMTFAALDVHEPPTMEITSPANNGEYSINSEIIISANASSSDDVIENVKFYIGTELVATIETEPYEYTWSGMDAGNYTIKAIATDSYGSEATDEISISLTDAPVTIPLNKGWNLIGSPLKSTTDIHIALSSIINDLRVVKDNDGFWDSSQPVFLNSLNSLKWGDGYLIYVENDCVLYWDSK